MAEQTARTAVWLTRAHWEALENAAIIAGWQQAKGRLSVLESDQIVLAALEATRKLIEQWAEQQDDHGQHVVEFRDDGWTLKHPLACRPNLFECAFNDCAIAGPPLKLGRYAVTLGSSGLVIGEPA